MIMRLHIGILGLSAALLLSTYPARADYQSGEQAYEQKDYRKAYSEWLAAANASDAKSQLQLGRLFEDGFGVPQDYVEAHLWYNLAASNGEPGAKEARDALAAKMSKEQIAAAQTLAAAWKPNTEGSRASQSRPIGNSATGNPPSPAAPSPAELFLAAAFRGDLNTLKKQLDGGVNINTRTQNGWTALMLAIAKGHSPVIQELLARKADINAAAADGTTALMIASATANAELVSALLKAGADVNAKNKEGVTALVIAEKMGHTVTASLLRPSAPVASPALPSPPSLTKEQITEVQRLLKSFGLYGGALSGKLDAKTLAAVKTFQKKHGLPQEDPPTVALLDALKREEGVRSQQATEHFSAAFDALKAKRFATAVTEFKTGLALKPNPEAEFYLGETYREQGKMNLARSQYDRSLKLNPHSPVAEKARQAKEQLADSEQHAEQSPDEGPSAPAQAQEAGNPDGDTTQPSPVGTWVGSQTNVGSTKNLKFTLTLRPDGTSSVIVENTLYEPAGSGSHIPGCPADARSASYIVRSDARWSFNDQTTSAPIFLNKAGNAARTDVSPACFDPPTPIDKDAENEIGMLGYLCRQSCGSASWDGTRLVASVGIELRRIQ